MTDLALHFELEVHQILITGAPRTKKTSNQLVQVGKKGAKRMIVMPSKAWRQWSTSCQLYRQPDGVIWELKGMELPDRPYNCRALFYRDAERGDAVGYYQGLADLLEKRGVLVNDGVIRQWDGSRLLISRQQPRVEVWLEAL